MSGTGRGGLTTPGFTGLRLGGRLAVAAASAGAAFDLPAPRHSAPPSSSPSREDLRLQSSASTSFCAEAGLSKTFDLQALVLERQGSGTAASDRYRVTAKVGAGGYGTVYVAEDLEIPGRKVAVKHTVATSVSKRRAFENEVALLKRLDHPNICRILETQVSGRALKMVLELCEGGDVFERIAAKGKLCEELAADITKQVAAALKYAHSRGLAHRDIKPENICFCSADEADSHVKVIDWGAGHFFGDAEICHPVGSVAYAAPEMRQSNRVKYTSACDLWSLGITTYVMLSGMPPFWGSLENKLARMKAELYPLEDEIWKGISEAAKALVRGLLRSQPDMRLSVNEVLEHPWLRGRSARVEAKLTRQVLSDMQEFSSKSSHFNLVFAVTVAKQLDQRSLQDLYEVFCDMDANGDGVLDFHEVLRGFESAFGMDSEQLADLETMFARLDLDGSGTIDYSEFCAAGLGERLITKEATVCAAFRDFDRNERIKQGLQELGFEAWLRRMRCRACKGSGPTRACMRFFAKAREGAGTSTEATKMQLMPLPSQVTWGPASHGFNGRVIVAG